MLCVGLLRSVQCPLTINGVGVAFSVLFAHVFLYPGRAASCTCCGALYSREASWRRKKVRCCSLEGYRDTCATVLAIEEMLRSKNETVCVYTQDQKETNAMVSSCEMSCKRRLVFGDWEDVKRIIGRTCASDDEDQPRFFTIFKGWKVVSVQCVVGKPKAVHAVAKSSALLGLRSSSGANP